MTAGPLDSAAQPPTATSPGADRAVVSPRSRLVPPLHRGSNECEDRRLTTVRGVDVLPALREPAGVVRVVDRVPAVQTLNRLIANDLAEPCIAGLERVHLLCGRQR